MLEPNMRSSAVHYRQCDISRGDRHQLPSRRSNRLALGARGCVRIGRYAIHRRSGADVTRKRLSRVAGRKKHCSPGGPAAARAANAREPPGRYRTFPPDATSSDRTQPSLADRGLFLDETWRLHPEICAFTSELFYDGRLAVATWFRASADQVKQQDQWLRLAFLPVVHEGNQNSSPEEADAIRDLVAEILNSKATWIDRENKES